MESSSSNSYDEDLEANIEIKDIEKDGIFYLKSNSLDDFSFPLKSKTVKKCPLKKKSSIISLFKKHQRHTNSPESPGKNTNNNKKKKILDSYHESIIKSQKENFEKNYKILKDDFSLLEEYEKKIFKDTNLDLMFIMDLTGSMCPWLHEARENIHTIIEEILDNNPGTKIRVSFVGYYDFEDRNQKRKYESMDFTEDIKSFKSFLEKLDCFGGGDEPEDLVGGLRVGLNMNWISNAKYAILVCDAPCHGKKYHDLEYDLFEGGDPDGVSLEDVMIKYYEKEITFYCIDIEKDTDKMFGIMKNIYNNDDNKFYVEKIGNSVHDFSFFVSFSASELLGNTKYNKINFSQVILNYRKEIIEKIMDNYLNNKLKKGSIDNKGNIQDDMNTMKLINEIEKLNIGDKDKKLLEFIDRMSGLGINDEKVNQYNEKDYNTINLDDKIMNGNSQIEIKYIIKALFYKKNINI